MFINPYICLSLYICIFIYFLLNTLSPLSARREQDEANGAVCVCMNSVGFASAVLSGWPCVECSMIMFICMTCSVSVLDECGDMQRGIFLSGYKISQIQISHAIADKKNPRSH